MLILLCIAISVVGMSLVAVRIYYHRELERAKIEREKRFKERVDEIQRSLHARGGQYQLSTLDSSSCKEIVDELEQAKRQGKSYKVLFYIADPGLPVPTSNWHRVGEAPNPDYAPVRRLYDEAVQARESAKESIEKELYPGARRSYNDAVEGYQGAMGNYEAAYNSWSEMEGTVFWNGDSPCVWHEEEPEKPEMPVLSDYINESQIESTLRQRIKNGDWDLPELPDLPPMIYKLYAKLEVLDTFQAAKTKENARNTSHEVAEFSEKDWDGKRMLRKARTLKWVQIIMVALVLVLVSLLILRILYEAQGPHVTLAHSQPTKEKALSDLQATPRFNGGIINVLPLSDGNGYKLECKDGCAKVHFYAGLLVDIAEIDGLTGDIVKQATWDYTRVLIGPKGADWQGYDDFIVRWTGRWISFTDLPDSNECLWDEYCD